MKTLPSPERMYRALVDRDTSFDGAFFAGIRTTGIFCRPGCGARKPRRENVEFYASPDDALRAGYRPCLRCKPLELAGELPKWVHTLFKLVERADRRVDSSALRNAGVHPARAARWFKEHFGMTFMAYQRARRVSATLFPLSTGGDVASAAVASGFESESGFRDAFERFFGAPPRSVAQSARAPARDARVLHMQWIPTPIGPLLAAAVDEGLCFLEFIDRRALTTQIAVLRRRVPGSIVPGEHRHLDQARTQLESYFAGRTRDFSVPLHAPGTDFQLRVWSALRAIPYGETRSYAQFARTIGEPTAVRAVANANGQNRLAIMIPCHRVIGSSGELTGYGGGVWRKQWLLDRERGE